MKERLMRALTRDDLDFLGKEPLLRVQPRVAALRGSGEVLARTEGGLLLLDRVGGVPMLCADHGRAVRALEPALPAGTHILVSDCSPMDDWLMEKRGLDGRSVCNNVVYLGQKPVPVQTDIELRPLPLSEAERVSENYPLHDLETIRIFIGEGRLLGGYRGEELVGFLGWHEEGSMGLLHVFAPFRRRGYAYAMEGLQINMMLGRGELPFGQVIQGNDASMALQLKLGFTREDRTVSWLYRTGD